MDYHVVNNTIYCVRFNGKFFYLSLISVHAPTEDELDEEKEAIYYELNRFYNNIRTHGVKLILVLWDFNVKIAKKQAFYPI